MKRQLRFIFPLAIFAALVSVFFFTLKQMNQGEYNPRDVPSPLIGKPAPSFSLPMLSDMQTQLAPEELRGQVWLLNVWASWCVSCRAEHEVVTRVAREQNLKILGLNYKDDLADAVGWLRRFGNPYFASVVDADGSVGIDWGVYGVPETFVIDKNGVVRYKHIGPITDASAAEVLVPLVRELEAES